jgi:hypothetical protein
MSIKDGILACPGEERLIVVVGPTRSGKTSWAWRAGVNYLLRNSNRGLVVGDPNGTFPPVTENEGEGITARYRHLDLAEGLDADELEEIRACTYSLVVLDDCKLYSLNGGDELNRLIIRRGHRRQDLMLLYHSVRQVQPKVVEQATDFVFFRLNDPHDTIVKRLDIPFPRRVTQGFHNLKRFQPIEFDPIKARNYYSELALKK